MKTLFDNIQNEWEKEWKDMPEFIQGKQRPFKKLIVRFRNEKEYQDFAKLIGQKLTNKTKSIWVPTLVRGINSDKIYTDEK